jgi:hypothetical protein
VPNRHGVRHVTRRMDLRSDITGRPGQRNLVDWTDTNAGNRRRAMLLSPVAVGSLLSPAQRRSSTILNALICEFGRCTYARILTTLRRN